MHLIYGSYLLNCLAIFVSFCYSIATELVNLICLCSVISCILCLQGSTVTVVYLFKIITMQLLLAAGIISY